MADEDYEHVYKIILLGDATVGNSLHIFTHFYSVYTFLVSLLSLHIFMV